MDFYFYESEEGTVPLFENIGGCSDFIINNSYLRHLFESILMEKDMYNCISQIQNSTTRPDDTYVANKLDWPNKKKLNYATRDNIFAVHMKTKQQA